jgi:DNA-binding PadR family transcriptional regulator
VPVTRSYATISPNFANRYICSKFIPHVLSNISDTSTDGSREYVRIQPSADTLTPETVETHLRRLHSLRLDADGSLLSRFTDDPPATIECLLVSTGETITYAFSIDDPTQTDALETVLRALFPATYDLERGPLPERDVLETHDAAAAVEYYGTAERRDDWQTGLTAFAAFQDGAESHAPLATLAEAMADTETPVVYQTLIRAKADWSGAAEERELDLAWGTDTLMGKFIEALLMPVDREQPDPLPSQETRIEDLRARDARRSFAVNARAVVLGENPQVSELETAFDGLQGEVHGVTGITRTGEKADEVRTAIAERTVHPPAYERLITYVPWTRNWSRGIVADPSELGSFCVVGGALTAGGARGLASTPGERTNLRLPPDEQIGTYESAGLTLGRPTDADGEAGDALALPPSLQPMHVAWFGKTGSGKSTAFTAAMLDNHRATGGADVFIEPKGDGMTVDYLRAHYARYGDLEDVLYFDCTELLPAVSVFDIRELLDAGVPRDQAIEGVIAHYLEMLQAVMGAERFERAVRSPDVIRALIKALFDPVHGVDAFAHKDLHDATRRLASQQRAPPVSEPELARTLEGLVENDSRTFQDILQGVSNRIEKITLDRRLATMFNHVAPAESASDPNANANADANTDVPNLDFGALLNENKTVIFDLGGLRSEATRVVSLVVLSELWRALKRRAGESQNQQQPVVNLYLEEASSLAVTDLLGELLSQGRGFGLSVTLAMQYPAQLRNADERVYDEVLNDVGTFVVGNVPIDRKLAERLVTDDMDREQVGARLRALGRGEWLVKPAAEYGAPDVRPFQVESVQPPRGHPAHDGTDRLDTATRGFQTALHDLQERTESRAGVTLDEPRVVEEARGDRDAGDAETKTSESESVRVDSALPHTKRLPAGVEYDDSRHALVCASCGSRYGPRMAGMKEALSCCSDTADPLADVERDDVPICALDLKLSATERAASEYTTGQLCFLQAVFNASQLRYGNMGYDLRKDSMVRLREYTGVNYDAVNDLLEDGLVREDCTRPHKLYSLTPAGREAIGESFREGVAFGDGSGDLDESSQHVLAVEVGRQLLEAEYVSSDASSAVEVRPYFEPEGMHARLDCAALDADGEVVVAFEAERINKDVREAVPSDFDKMAACEPAEAIWIVMSRSGGHEVLQALNDPPDGEPRVEKTYSESTAPRYFKIDTPGLSAMYSLNYVLDSIVE